MERRLIKTGQRLSPSARKIIKLRERAFRSGGTSLELQIPTNYIREISKKLNYDITSDASLIMTPNTIGEGRLFNAKPNALRNLLRYSEDFVPIWGGTNITETPDAILAPNSTMTADMLTSSAANSFESQSVDLTIGTYTSSIYIRNNNSLTSRLRSVITTGNEGIITINWSGSTLTSLSSLTGVKSSFESLPDNWYRVILTYNIVVAGTLSYRIYPDINLANTSIYVWGAQLELGSTPTPYQRTTDGIIDFQVTRATTATVIQKDGSIGESCYNLLGFSDDFNNAYWTKTRTTIGSNVLANPINGNVDADKLTEDNTASATHYTQRVVTLETGKNYVYSAWVKSAERNFIALQITGGTAVWGVASSPFIIFNSNTGLVTSSNNATYTVTAYSDGWYRIRLITNTVIDGVGSSTAVQILLSTSGITSGLTYSGDNVSGAYIYGAQLVKGSTQRDYLKTTNRLSVSSISYDLGSDKPALLSEPQRTNIIFPSATATTQTRTVTAQSYTLSFYGTGTVSLSGAYTGSLIGIGTNTLVSVTFTPTAGSLTFTITGTVTDWQVEAGSNYTSRIITVNAAVTRNAYTSFVDLRNNNISEFINGTLFIEFISLEAPSNTLIGFSFYNSVETECRLLVDTNIRLVVSGLGTFSLGSNIIGKTYKLALVYSTTNTYIFINGVKGNVYGAFPFLPIFLKHGNNYTYSTFKTVLWKRTLSDAECINITTL